MKFRIYTTENGIRTLHTAYMHNEADEKFDSLVNSGKYEKVEMAIGSNRIKDWNR